MRPHLVLLALGISAAGCGGGSTTTPPGTSGTPASVTIQAGDGQRGAPGTVLPVAPTVLVRDAAGLPVANETVTFVIDSGGGAVTGGTAITGSDGVARLGSWQLGPAEGRQVLKVTVGSLSPVRFAAASLTPDIAFPAQTVATTGGTMSISRPGLPLDGFQLQLPNGALTASSTITLAVRSPAAVTLPASLTLLTPLVAISSSPVDLNQPALLRFVSPRETGAIRVAFVRNPVSGEMHFLPTVVSDAAGITVALGDLSPGGAAGGAPGASLRADLSELETGLAKLAEALRGDFDTGYRPGVDDWDFPRMAIAGVPDVSPGATVDPAESMMGTSAWYFMHQKTDGALWQRFQDARGIGESNRRGLRWVGITGQVFTVFWWNSAMVTTMTTEVQQNPANASRTFFDNVRLGMGSIMASQGPIPIFLYAGTSNDAPKMGLAYRSVGNTLYFAIPDSPGREYQAQFDAAGVMQPFVVTTAGGGTFTVTAMQQASQSNQLMNRKLTAQYPTVVAGTIGNIAGWPTAQLRGHALTDVADINFNLDATDVLLGVSMQHWWKCAGCATSGYGTGGTPADDHYLLWRRASRNADGTFAPMPTTVSTYASFSAQDITPGLDSYLGFALYQPGPGSTINNPNGKAWLDWQLVHYRKLPIQVSPKDPQIVDQTDLTFTAAVTGAPAGSKYRWRVDGPDGTTVSAETTSPVALTTTVASPGETDVVMQVLDGTTKRIIATDTSKVNFVVKPLAISPSPLVGGYGVDYQLTATYANATPANPSWVWDLGDGRIITTSVNTITVKYPVPTPSVSHTFNIKCTLKTGATAEAVAKSTAVIGSPFAVWKFGINTAVQVLTPGGDPGWSGPGLGSSFNRYIEQLNAFHGLQRDGGLLYVARDTTIQGAFIKAGMYLLDGLSISAAVLSTGLRFTAEGSQFGVPNNPALVYTNWLAPQQSPPKVADVPAFNELFAAPASLTAGSFTGLGWEWTSSYFSAGQIINFPLFTRGLQMALSGNTATGTLTIISRNIANGQNQPKPETLRWTITFTFEATRVQ